MWSGALSRPGPDSFSAPAGFEQRGPHFVGPRECLRPLLEVLAPVELIVQEDHQRGMGYARNDRRTGLIPLGVA